jgi:hypothetical protein
MKIYLTSRIISGKQEADAGDTWKHMLIFISRKKEVEIQDM